MNLTAGGGSVRFALGAGPPPTPKGIDMSQTANIDDVLSGRARWAVICADCLTVLPTIPVGVVGAVVTDPPYGLGDKLKSGPGGWAKLHGSITSTWDKATHPGVLVALKTANVAIVWGGNYYPLPPIRGWLIWDKIVRTFDSGHCEMAWTTLDQPVRAFNYSHGQLANEGKVHPTQKPVPLMEWCLSFLPPDDLILDPFCGSGTTGVAAIKTGRRFIGIEIDGGYAAIARRRIAEAADTLWTPPPPKPEQAEMFA